MSRPEALIPPQLTTGFGRISTPYGSVADVLGEGGLHRIPVQYRPPDDPISVGQLFDEEWGNFMLQRRILADELLERLGLKRELQAANPDMPEEVLDQALGPLEGKKAPLPDDAIRLIGAALHYGIENPEKIPLDVLAQMVESFRVGRREGAAERGALRGLGAYGVDVAGAIGVGVGEDVVRAINNLPFIGSVMRERGAIEESKIWLAKLGEAFRGDMIGEEVEGLPNIVRGMFEGNEVAGWQFAKGTARYGTYMVSGAMLYRMAGAALGLSAPAAILGMAGARLAPIAKMAAAGAITEVIMEGGSEAPIQERGLYVALGTLGGAAHGAGRTWDALVGGGLLGGTMGYAAAGEEGIVPGAAAGSGIFAMMFAPSIFNRLRKSFPTSGSETIDPRWWQPTRDRPRAYDFREVGVQGPPGPPPAGLIGPGPAGALPGPPTMTGTLDPLATLGRGQAQIPPRSSMLGEADWQVMAEQGMLPGTRMLPPGPAGLPGPEGLPPSAYSMGPVPQPALPPGAYPMGPAPPSPWMQTPPEVRGMVRRAVGERRAAQRAAEVDPMTNLGNRTAWERARPAAELDPNVEVVVFDLNNLKAANDLVSHEFGDMMIRRIGSTLRESSAELGIPLRAFRTGGDEFVALAPTGTGEALRSTAATHYGTANAGNYEVSLSGASAQTFGEADGLLQAAKRDRGAAAAFRPLTAATERISGPSPAGLPPAVQQAYDRWAAAEARMSSEGVHLEGRARGTVQGQSTRRMNQLTRAIEEAGLPVNETMARLAGSAPAAAPPPQPGKPLELVFAGEYDPGDLFDAFTATPNRVLLHQNIRPGEKPWRVSFFEDQHGAVDALGHYDFSTWEEAHRYIRDQLPDFAVAGTPPAVAPQPTRAPMEQGPALPPWVAATEVTLRPGQVEPPVPEGMVRLYRGQEPGEGGFWFTQDREYALWYASGRYLPGDVNPATGQGYPTPELVYVDLPPERAMQLRMDDPAAPTERVNESFDYLREFYLHEADLAGARTLALQPIEAIGDAVQLTKHTSIMESPAVAGMAAQPRYDEADVAHALVNSYPGSVVVVQDIPNAGSFITQNAQRGYHVEFVTTKSGSMDALVSQQRFPKKLVEQYREFDGVFEGRRVYLGSVEAEVVKPGSDVTVLRDVYGSAEPRTLPTSMLGLGRHADRGSRMASPALYRRFQEWALGRMNEEAAAAGLAQPFDWFSPQTTERMPWLIDEFFDRARPEFPEQEQLLRNYFEWQRVEDMRRLAGPEELETLARAQREAASDVLAGHLQGHEIDRVYSLAETRGFGVTETPGGGYILRDQLGDLEVPLANEEAAYQFLRNFDREMPDVAPIIDMPIELISNVPGAVHPGTTTDMIPPLATINDALEDAVRRAEREFEGGAGDVVGIAFGRGSVPPPPPPPPSLGGAAGQPQLPPPSRETAAQQFRRLLRDSPEKFQEMLDRTSNMAVRAFMPMRNYTMGIEEVLHGYGIDAGRMWKQYSDIVTGVAKMHNEAIPYYQEIRSIINEFPRKWVRKGDVTRILEESDELRRVQMMDDLGMTVKHRETVQRARDFFDNVFGEAGLSAARYLMNYIPHVRNLQRAGKANPFGDTDTLPREIQFFAEYAREGNIDLRQMDLGVLMTHWVRAWQFKKHVGAPFETMAKTWQVSVPDYASSIPAPLRRVVRDWLQIVRYGHNPEHEFAVQGVRQIMNKLGAPVTDTEVISMYNTAFGNSYRAMLGLRPDVWFRDSIQPWLSGTKIGMKEIASVYTSFFKDKQARQEMWERALRNGWVERGMVQVAEAGAFTSPTAQFDPTHTMTSAMARRRERFAQIGDVIHDLTPKAIRGGIQGTWLDPLYVYTREGELNRLISGEAGWRRATRAIQKHRAEGVVDIEALASEAGANAWRGPVQREFRRLIDAGNDEAAANLLAQEAANLQFRYGTREHSPGVQSLGMKGRMAMMLGTFTNQYAANMLDLFAKDIPRGERAKMAARYSTVLATLGGAAAVTGWNFGKWQWHESLTFAGGPPVGALTSMWNTATAIMAEATGEYVSPEQSLAISQATRGTAEGILPAVGAGVFGTFFPYAGGLRTLQGVGSAISGGGTEETLPQFLLTGTRPERGRRENAEENFLRQATREAEALDAILRAPPSGGGGPRQ